MQNMGGGKRMVREGNAMRPVNFAPTCLEEFLPQLDHKADVTQNQNLLGTSLCFLSREVRSESQCQKVSSRFGPLTSSGL